MDVQRGTIVVTREDRAVDSVKLVTEGLRIGRLPECEVSLNHPSVSRLHAGVNYIAGRFFLINLSHSSSTTLNGRLVAPDEAEAIADGDVLQIGPFGLYFNYRKDELLIRVSQQIAMNAGEMDARSEAKSGEFRMMMQRAATKRASSEVADALKVFWGKRTREKAGRPSPLHPRRPPRPGKSRFNWTPTRDLVRPWPFSIFIWGMAIVAALSALAWHKYANAFAPMPLSNSHAAATLTLDPPVARQPNSGSCTTCHTIKSGIEANCASCHQTEAFNATVIKPHREAGISCLNCHTEHRGADFSPMNSALAACAACHNDDNPKLYNGRSMHTPHGGTFGYPVRDGEWVWKGLDDEELATKPDVAEYLKNSLLNRQIWSGLTIPEIVRRVRDNTLDPKMRRDWISTQFHGIHIYRVRVFTGIEGIEDVDSENRVLSCSSCHRTGQFGARLDRLSPRATCSKCHTNLFFERADAKLPQAAGPSCTSCHVQHLMDKNWTPAFFSAPKGAPPAPDLKMKIPTVTAP
ncbi:MAG TPA: FHA domain-containing protein [Pyrinomonadaceae bacterium]